MASNSVFTADKTEIGEIDSFSVRRTGWETWDASLPWDSLADCVQVLTQAYAMPPGSIARGSVYQVQTIPDNYRPQSILQWLDTEDKTYVLSLYYDELPSLASVLSDLATFEGIPLDLDATETAWRSFEENTLKVLDGTGLGGLPGRVTALEEDVSTLDGAVTDLEADLTLVEADVDGLQELTETGRLSDAELDAAYAPLAEGAKRLSGKAPSDAPSTYPVGVSYTAGTVGSLWPGEVPTVTTVRWGGSRTSQTAVVKTTGVSYFRAEGDGDAWGPWLESPSNADVENLVSISEGVRYPAEFFGAVGDGIADDTAAADAACESGLPIRFLEGKTYRLTATVGVTRANVDATGAKFIMEGAGSTVQCMGSFTAAVAVTGYTQAMELAAPDGGQINIVTMTLSSTVDWKPNDIVMLAGDDIIPLTKDSANGSPSQNRVGEYLIVRSVSGTTLKCEGTIDDPITTNMRVGKMLTADRFRWNGGEFDYTDSAYNTGNGYTFFLASHVRPRISNVIFKRVKSACVYLRTCYDWDIDSIRMFRGPNDLSRSAFGYGVANFGSAFGKLRNSYFTMTRHAYTNGGSPDVVGSMNLDGHGRPHDNTISNCFAVSPSGTAFDSHTQGRREKFIGCTVYNSDAGFGLRGQYHTVENASMVNVGTGIVIFMESTGDRSYGHTINGVTINNCANILTASVNRRAGGIAENQKELVANTISNVVAKNVRSRIMVGDNTTIHASNIFVEQSSAASVTALGLLFSNSTLILSNWDVNAVKVTDSSLISVAVNGNPAPASQVEVYGFRVRGACVFDYFMAGTTAGTGFNAVNVFMQVLPAIAAKQSAYGLGSTPRPVTF